MAIFCTENVHGPMSKVKKLEFVFRVGDLDPPKTRNTDRPVVGR